MSSGPAQCVLSLSQCSLPCCFLGLWEPTWPGFGRKDQKQSLCFVYKTLPTPRGGGGGGCACPMAKAAQPLTTPASYRHAHTHTRVGRGSPGGWGAREGGKSVCLPKTMSALSQEKCVNCSAAVGSREVPSAPCPVSRCSPPGTAPSTLDALPAAVCLLKLNFCFL